MGYEKRNLELISLYKENSDSRYLEELYFGNIRLLEKVCSKFMYRSIEKDDLLQECYFALVYAVDRYVEENCNFSTFLYNIAYWHLLRYIRNNRIISIPDYMIDLINKYVKLSENDRKTDYDICCLLEITLEQLEEIKKAARCASLKSLDQPINEEEDTFLVDTIADTSDSFEDGVIDQIYQEQLKAALQNSIEKLSPVDRDLIIYRFFKGMSLQEIDPSKTVERNRQKVNKALRRLRRDEKLRSFYDNQNAYVGTSLTHFMNTRTSSVERLVIRLNQG